MIWKLRIRNPQQAQALSRLRQQMGMTEQAFMVLVINKGLEAIGTMVEEMNKGENNEAE